MKRFADLYARLDETTKTGEKVAAMVAYFRAADPADAAWAVYFLTGRKPRQIVPTKLLRQWASESAGVPDWLFDESYHAVGDLAETMALLVPDAGQSSDHPLREWVEERLLPLRDQPPGAQKAAMLAAWAELDARQRFVWNKLITGAFRVGVSQLLVVRALADVSGAPAPTVAHRLMGEWSPTPGFYSALTGTDAATDAVADASRPYPFYLASPVDGDPATLGPVAEWAAEWKWDGIRAQLIRRAGATYLWSRGEELVTERYPEVVAAGAALPDGTVIDGELLPWGDDGVRPFAELQRRIGRKDVGAKILADVPVVLLAYDLLEWQGRDVRPEPWEWRRATLEGVVAAAGRIAPAKAVRRERQRTLWGEEESGPPSPLWRGGASRGAPPLPCRRRRVLGSARPTARGESRPERRGVHVEAPRQCLRRRPGARRLVEVEDRPVQRRRGDGERPARQR